MCDCNVYGTVDASRVCEKEQGQCPCKESIEGQHCDTCKDEFYNFPAGQFGRVSYQDTKFIPLLTF